MLAQTHHSTSLASGTEQEHLATTEALNHRVREESRQGIDRRVDTTEDKRKTTLQADVVLEDNGAVDKLDDEGQMRRECTYAK